jgi:hypothetical protein
METLLSPLQLDATSGVGKTLIVPEPERIVRFIIRSKGTPMGGEITFECCPVDTGQAPGKVSARMVWRALKTVPVPTDIGVVTGYYAGKVSGMFRARISKPIIGGVVTVWPLVARLIGNTKTALEPVVR